MMLRLACCRFRRHRVRCFDGTGGGVMERRKFTREFKLEAVKLIKERGVSYAQASHDLSVHQTQLRNWVKAFADDPQHAFPGHGQMKPEQVEIARLKREVIRAQGRTGHPKKSRGLLREGDRREVRLHREAPGDLAGGMVVRGARCLAGWVLCLADTTAQSAQPERRRAGGEGARQLPCQRPNLWRQAGVARHARGRHVVRTASDRAIDAATGSQSASATASPAARSG